MSDTSDKKSKFPTKPILAAVVLIGVVVSYSLFDVTGLLKDLLRWIRDLGPWAPAAYFGLYVLATVLLVPGFIFTVGAGFVFGLVEGSVWASLSSTAGATAAFLVGRYLTRDWSAKTVASSESFQAIDKAVGREGWKIVWLIRLSPLIPFNFLNYGLGLTKIRLVHYVLASWIGMLPGTIVYVYLGSLASDLATIGAEGQGRTTAEWALYVIGLLATIAVTIYVTRIARRALEQKVS